MKIIKTSQEPQAVLQPGHLEDINRLSRTPLTEAEVYAFSVRLCDNEVDRDGERFAPRTLEQLAPLFVGKSGIFVGKLDLFDPLNNLSILVDQATLYIGPYLLGRFAGT